MLPSKMRNVNRYRLRAHTLKVKTGRHVNTDINANASANEEWHAL
jgi:hypothetical protein